MSSSALLLRVGASESGTRRVFEAPTSSVTEQSVTLIVSSSQLSVTTHHSTSADHQHQQLPDICHCDNIDAISVVRGQVVAFKDNVRRINSFTA